MWHRFNDEHFDGTMLPPKFRRTRSNDYWACYENDPQERQGTIYINYKSHWQMTAIFFHEMVHQYQWDVYSNIRVQRGLPRHMSHGPTFYIWRKKLAKYGIALKQNTLKDHHWFKKQDVTQV